MKNDIQLYLGDSEEILKQLPANSVDTLICDPPYGLSFMGKKWDYDVPSIELWKECLRVLKPGGTALIFAGSRTQHRMACNVEDAGFILKDCIMWLYGSGFPKSLNIGKAINKIDGVEFEASPAKGVGFMKPDSDDWHQTKNMLTQKGESSERAKQWEGWGTALKPAYEPILVAMKPNEGTYAENALKHGVSGLNIDGGRIDAVGYTKGGQNTSIAFKTGDKGVKQPRNDGSQGRFPANIILDEEAGKILDEQSGVSKSSISKNIKRQKRNSNGVFDDKNNGLQNGSTEIEGFNDKGGASRFFYCAKAPKVERNKGCEELDSKERIRQRLAGEHKNTFSKNSHPTVKPLKLMEYLCTLTKTPTGGIVLDPFMGSGTTGIACKLTGRKFIGIEMNEEYMRIAQARIKTVKN